MADGAALQAAIADRQDSAFQINDWSARMAGLHIALYAVHLYIRCRAEARSSR